MNSHVLCLMNTGDLCFNANYKFEYAVLVAGSVLVMRSTSSKNRFQDTVNNFCGTAGCGDLLEMLQRRSRKLLALKDSSIQF